MNIEALMKLRNQVDERHLGVAIGLGVAIALTIIGLLAAMDRSPDDGAFDSIVAHPGETWARRGAKRRWMVAAMKKGKKMESFLIKGR